MEVLTHEDFYEGREWVNTGVESTTKTTALWYTPVSGHSFREKWCHRCAPVRPCGTALTILLKSLKIGVILNFGENHFLPKADNIWTESCTSFGCPFMKPMTPDFQSYQYSTAQSMQWRPEWDMRWLERRSLEHCVRLHRVSVENWRRALLIIDDGMCLLTARSCRKCFAERCSFVVAEITS